MVLYDILTTKKEYKLNDRRYSTCSYVILKYNRHTLLSLSISIPTLNSMTLLSRISISHIVISYLIIHICIYSFLSISRPFYLSHIMLQSEKQHVHILPSTIRQCLLHTILKSFRPTHHDQSLIAIIPSGYIFPQHYFIYPSPQPAPVLCGLG